MKVIRGLANCRPEHKNAALTIGNFDGLHPGHQKMLRTLQAEAGRLNTHSIVMTFEPLPREYFTPDNTAARLMNRPEKIQTLRQFAKNMRPDHLLFLNFNPALAAMTAEAFVEDVLIDRLAIKSLIIGDDFCFGADRRGDLALLQQYSQKGHFTILSIESHCIDDQRVSSTLIREALANDQLAEADKMLGRPYTLCGRVSHGAKRGRGIGFPTANIHLKRRQTPLQGVYSVTMHSEKYGDVHGIANIGRRPTVDGEHIQLEVHLFDFDASLYGERVCVSFQHKIRDEKKFDSFEELKQQIQRDCEQAKKRLSCV